MKPDAYCEQRAAPPGSSLYYSLLFTPPPRRTALLALHALRAELVGIVRECSEPSVAQTKLAWWRYQVESIYEGAPEHPVAHALAPVIEAHDLPREQFQELMDGVEMTLAPRQFADTGELSLYCHRVDGTIALLSAEVCGYEDHHTPRCIHELGMAVCQTRIILDVAANTTSGHVQLPLDEQRSAAATAGAGRDEALAVRLRHQSEKANAYFRAGLTRLPEGDRLGQLHWLTLAAIHRATLNELERTGFVPRARQLALTPLRKLWIAWVTQRRERRCQRRWQHGRPVLP
ncbi:MAG: squalene/phytoene synthase family protein [Pseudomonadota bacterium]|nr:MAG: squalene/phytoene synthase family protein [Pseudomonadota bacterium]